MRTNKGSALLAVLWISAGLYLTGVFTAYLLGPLLMRYAS